MFLLLLLLLLNFFEGGFADQSGQQAMRVEFRPFEGGRAQDRNSEQDEGAGRPPRGREPGRNGSERKS